jgi:aspartate racemase
VTSLSPSKSVLGILGGLGPVASAEFLRTIYDNAGWTAEQDAPVVLLYSDPSFADRTHAFLAGDSGFVLDQLIDRLYRLVNAGASQLVICCVTMHYLLPRIPSELRLKIISLVDCIFDEVAKQDTKCLLLCSTGARRLHIFEDHGRWPELHQRFVLPDEEDQQMIHREIIHGVKSKHSPAVLFPVLHALLSKYRVSAFVAGCTEIHVLARWLRADSGTAGRYWCVDPLAFVAERFIQESYFVREHSLEL